MGTKKGQRRKTARRAYEPIKEERVAGGDTRKGRKVNLFATVFPSGTRKFISGKYKGLDANAVARSIRRWL